MRRTGQSSSSGNCAGPQAHTVAGVGLVVDEDGRLTGRAGLTLLTLGAVGYGLRLPSARALPGAEGGRVPGRRAVPSVPGESPSRVTDPPDSGMSPDWQAVIDTPELRMRILFGTCEFLVIPRRLGQR
jgi:hypothetical protein